MEGTTRQFISINGVSNGGSRVSFNGETFDLLDVIFISGVDSLFGAVYRFKIHIKNITEPIEMFFNSKSLALLANRQLSEVYCLVKRKETLKEVK